mgnify:CR=1 FL=1
MPLETAPNANFRVLPEITVASDTRDYLAHAGKQALKYDDYELIVDIDAHLQEGGFWSEIIDLLENDVLKQTAQEMMRRALKDVPPDRKARLKATIMGKYH